MTDQPMGEEAEQLAESSTGSLPLGELFAAARAVADRSSAYADEGEPICGAPYPPNGTGKPCQLPPDHWDEHPYHARPASAGFDTWSNPEPNADPGPVPDEPDVPPLTLRTRLINALDNCPELDHIPSEIMEGITDQLHAAVSAGADFGPRDDNAEMTPGQALAYLLDLPEWARIDRLSSLLGQAHAGQMCRTMGHDLATDENLALRIKLQRYDQTLMQIGRLASPPDQGTWSTAGVLNEIGQLAAQALTGDGS